MSTARSERDDAPDPAAAAILDFWFEDARESFEALTRRSKAWFTADPEFDREIARRFAELLDPAAAGALDRWADSPRGRLALVILLDQFPRNLHRGSAAAFLHDAHALELGEAGIARGHDRALTPIERVFLLMPHQHAEDREVQARSVSHFEALAAAAPDAERAYYENTAAYAREHRDIIERFGRFPHRNRVLGRESTPEETEYLAGGASSFGQ